MSATTKQKLLGSISLLGGLCGLAIIVGFARADWGAPGTAAYITYQFLNLFMAGALTLMVAGWLGVWRVWRTWGAGLALLGAIGAVIGNVAEIWIFTELAYDETGNMRQVSFVFFSLSTLVLLLGALLLGVAIWRGGRLPRWAAVLYLLALPLDVALFLFYDLTPFFVPSLLALLNGYLLLTQAQAATPAVTGGAISA